jgi:RNA polymerase sigma-70 factor (ECF subfamily)
LEGLFQALESPLLAYSLRLVREREPAEDIVQEAFMRLHAHFTEVREPRAWLYRTIHNLAVNHLRTTRRVVSLHSEDKDEAPDMDVLDPQPFPDEQIARGEAIGLVRISIEALDERSRELLHLKFRENLSYKEIAAKTRLKVGHVGYLLHHAIKAVAGELAKNGWVR